MTDFGVGDYVDLSVEEEAREANATLTALLLAVLARLKVEEVTLPNGWEDKAVASDRILLMDPLPSGAWKVRVVPRVAADDERVPVGGWVHSVTGRAIRVEGIAYDGTVVAYLHDGDGERERQPLLSVEEFLSSHVPAGAVPFIDAP